MKNSSHFSPLELNQLIFSRISGVHCLFFVYLKPPKIIVCVDCVTLSGFNGMCIYAKGAVFTFISGREASFFSELG